MRPLSTVVSATLMAAALVAGIGTTPSARATDGDYAINGTYVATSDGTYATTDYAFHNEATVRSTWTITSKCTTDVHCTGQVTSDQGWSAPLRTGGARLVRPTGCAELGNVPRRDDVSRAPDIHVLSRERGRCHPDRIALPGG